MFSYQFVYFIIFSKDFILNVFVFATLFLFSNVLISAFIFIFYIPSFCISQYITLFLRCSICFHSLFIDINISYILHVLIGRFSGPMYFLILVFISSLSQELQLLLVGLFFCFSFPGSGGLYCY